MFPIEEYEARWRRLADAVAARGYETAVMWQRSGGGYDRAGDVHWLVNYASLASGQEPPLAGGGLGRAFAALVFRGHEEPELHIAEPVELIDADVVATSRIVSHDNLPEGLARHLAAAGVEGPVLHNGDDFLPIQFMRIIEQHAPAVAWEPCADLMWEIHRIKSPRERDAMRETGEVATRSLSALMEGLIAGKPESEAAAAAAYEIVRAGGGYQRIAANHGAKSEHVMWSSGMYGFTHEAPARGELVRGWIYGPLHRGYWLDPGRTAVAGNAPSAEQRRLVEGCVGVVEGILAGIRPGATTTELGAVGDALMEAAGHDAPQDLWPLYGHGVGKDFYMTPVIPRLGSLPEYGGTYEEGMAVTVEVFMRHPGVGMAAFERTGLVGPDGFESLDRTPMLWW